MAGYTRQDTADNIANGKIIDADDLDSEFDAVESAFNSTTGHNHDGTAGEGARITAVGPAGEMTVTSTAIQPASDNALDLGTSSVEMKDGFFDGTLKTDVLTVDETSTFTGAVTASAAVSVGTTLTVGGAATFNGNVTLGNAASDTVAITADVASHVLPSADNTYDLGASASEWRNLYIDGTANIDSLVANTADINGGTVDGSVIGGASPAAITGTTVNGTTITASTGFSGPGGSITAINGSNIGSGTVANARLPATLTADTSGNAASATTLATARNFSLTGDVTAGPVSFDGSGNVALSTTIAANSVALGTDTTGNYVSNVTAGTGISVSHSPGEGSTATVTHGNTSSQASVNASGRTYIQDITLDDYGHVTSIGTATETAVTTNATNVAAAGALMDSECASVTALKATTAAYTTALDSKLDDISPSADVTDFTTVRGAGALMDSEVTNLAQVKAFDSSDYATAAQGTLANSAVQPNDSPTFGSVTVTGTVDGRDLSADGARLDLMDDSADVTNFTTVQAAGALMDSECSSVSSLKAINQALTTTSSPTFSGATITGSINLTGDLRTSAGSTVFSADNAPFMRDHDNDGRVGVEANGTGYTQRIGATGTELLWKWSRGTSGSPIVMGKFDADGELTCVSTNITSDERVKSDIVDANSQWSDIKDFRLCNYTMNETGGRHLGLIAQEAQAVSPGMVRDVSDDRDGSLLGINTSALMMKMLGALQEAQARIEELEAKAG